MTGAEILYVAPLPVVVARAVMTPPRDGEIAVAAEPAAGVRDESRVWHISENADNRLRRVRCLDFTHRGLLHLARHSRHIIALNILHREPARDPLLQDELRRADEWIHVEAARPYLPVERVGERDDAHADVMRHERGHDRLPRAR